MFTTAELISLLGRVADRTITAPQNSTHADSVINLDEWRWPPL
jgi:hypothetical protein